MLNGRLVEGESYQIKQTESAIKKERTLNTLSTSYIGKGILRQAVYIGDETLEKPVEGEWATFCCTLQENRGGLTEKRRYRIRVRTVEIVRIENGSVTVDGLITDIPISRGQHTELMKVWLSKVEALESLATSNALVN